MPRNMPNGPYRLPGDLRPLGMPNRTYAYESWHMHAGESIQVPAQRHARPVSSLLHFLLQCARTGYVLASPDARAFAVQYDTLTAPFHLVAYYHLPSLLPLLDPRTVNKQTEHGKTALFLAAWRNDAIMVKLLLKMDGVDVNRRDDRGNTALTITTSREVSALLRLDPRTKIGHGMGRGWPSRPTVPAYRLQPTAPANRLEPSRRPPQPTVPADPLESSQWSAHPMVPAYRRQPFLNFFPPPSLPQNFNCQYNNVGLRGGDPAEGPWSLCILSSHMRGYGLDDV
jgi:Ankyrin repeats (many copies)